MWIHAVVMAVLLMLGAGVHYFSKESDSPAEQLIEKLLKADGIEIDFSSPDDADDD